MSKKFSAKNFLALMGTALISSCTQADSNMASQQDYDTVKALIWEKEIAINDARPQSGPVDYLAASSDHYVAWPLRAGAVTIDQLREGAEKAMINARYPNEEKIDLFLEGFALQDDTAIIYYSTHRTRLADGSEVDERYHVGHVWERDDVDGDWKMLGSMVRQPTQ